ncbi:hypothetical protein LJC36_06490, partial [Desulfovibrio sp. OttesenSCG-928-C14]|nr:hypothetical protein [Desulfovibrio sp. OttesenSCG-928-C14]
MTTKFKIIAGFAAMVVLLGVVVWLGYTGMQQSSAGMSEYERLAKFNVDLRDLEVAMNSATTAVYGFVSNRSDEYINLARRESALALEHAKAAEDFAKTARTKELLIGLANDIGTFSRISSELFQSIRNSAQQYEGVVLPSFTEIGEALAAMTRQAESVGNTTALTLVSEVWL